MKKQELENIIKSKLEECSNEKLEVKLHRSCEYLTLTLTQMYEYLDVDFDTMTQLTDIFQTTKINLGDRYYSSGCDTCDYGSQYTITYSIIDSKLEIEDLV